MAIILGSAIITSIGFVVMFYKLTIYNLDRMQFLVSVLAAIFSIGTSLVHIPVIELFALGASAEIFAFMIYLARFGGGSLFTSFVNKILITSSGLLVLSLSLKFEWM